MVILGAENCWAFVETLHAVSSAQLLLIYFYRLDWIMCVCVRIILGEDLLKLISNRDSKSFTVKRRKCEHDRGRFHSCTITEEGKKPQRPPWQASTECLKRIASSDNKRRVPVGIGSSMSSPFDKHVAMKSIDWIHLLGSAGLYFVYCCDIAEPQKRVFYKLINWLNSLRQHSISRHQINQHELEGKLIIAEMEIRCPTYFMSINFHLLQHLCNSIRKCGPVHSFWMYVLNIYFVNVPMSNYAFIHFYNTRICYRICHL